MKTILVPVDFSDCMLALLETATSMATAFAAHVILLHVAAPEPEFIGYEPGPQTVRDSVARQFAAEHHRLHEEEKHLLAKGVETKALFVQGFPVEKIIHEAKRYDVDLIIMGSHGHGVWRHLLVGSVTEGVMRQVNCPVLVVPHRRTGV